jgi:CBS-domain-containing membrane protein
MTAQQMMTSPVVTVHPDASLEEAAGLLLRHEIATLPVVDDQSRLLSLVTESDVFRALGLRLGIGASPTAHLNPARLPGTVRDVMHRDVPRVKPSAGVTYCLRVLERHDGHTLVVVNGDCVEGVISLRDALRALTVPSSEADHEADGDLLPKPVACSGWHEETG